MMAAGRSISFAGLLMLAGTLSAVVGLPLVAVALGPQWDLETLWPSPVEGLILLVAGALLIGLGTLLWVSGLAAYVLVPCFSKAARGRQDYGSHRVVLASTLLAAVGGNLLGSLYLIPVALSGAADPTGRGMAGRLLSPTSLAAAAVSLDVALLAVVYFRVLRPGEVPWSALGLGLRKLGRRLLLGVAGGVALLSVSGLLELLLARVGVEQTQKLVFESVARASPGEFGLVLLAGAVIAPMAEELFFRGYVFRAYLERKGLRRAFLFSAGLFAVVHLDAAALIPLFSMGLLLAYLYHRTGSLIPPVIAHGVNNAVAFTLLYLGLA